jgi:hypothetical protein
MFLPTRRLIGMCALCRLSPGLLGRVCGLSGFLWPPLRPVRPPAAPELERPSRDRSTNRPFSRKGARHASYFGSPRPPVNAKGNNVVNCQQLPGAPNSSTIAHSLRLAARLELDHPRLFLGLRQNVRPGVGLIYQCAFLITSISVANGCPCTSLTEPTSRGREPFRGNSSADNLPN